MKTSIIAAALFLLAATPAFAHAHLLSEQPADGATIATAPSLLTLTFSESLSLAFSGITLTGPSGSVPLGSANLDAAGTTLSLPLATPLTAGVYTVAWHAVASDGHKTTGSYSFAVK